MEISILSCNLNPACGLGNKLLNPFQTPSSLIFPWHPYFILAPIHISGAVCLFLRNLKPETVELINKKSPLESLINVQTKTILVNIHDPGFNEFPCQTVHLTGLILIPSETFLAYGRYHTVQAFQVAVNLLFLF